MTKSLCLVAALIAAGPQQLSAPAIVARVREVDLRVRDLQAEVSMTIERGSETRRRRFRMIVQRDGPRYRSRIEVLEPAPMRGVRFLIHAERGKRNQQWSHFPDLALTRKIPGSRQDDPFLGSDVTYADLAGAAHLDDLKHSLLGEETVAGEPCWHLRGVPRRKIVYGALEGWVSQSRFTTVMAKFFDQDDGLIKTAKLEDLRMLDDSVWFAHRIVVESHDSRTVLDFDAVRVNEGVDPSLLVAELLGK